MFSRLASWMAVASRLTSTTKSKSGTRTIVRIPPSRISRRSISRVSIRAFFLGHPVEIAAVAHALQAFQLVDALPDGAPVGEHTAQPARGHVGHAGAHGFVLDRLLGLALGANEEHRAALGDRVAHQGVGLFESFDRFLQVDDVDAVAFGEDVGLHAGVPTCGCDARSERRFPEALS